MSAPYFRPKNSAFSVAQLPPEQKMSPVHKKSPGQSPEPQNTVTYVYPNGMPLYNPLGEGKEFFKPSGPNDGKFPGERLNPK